jgi:hypothetical protein
MEARFVVCSALVSIDQRSNALSLFNLCEEFNIPAFPFAFPHMAVVALLTREANEPSEPANVEMRFFLDAQEIFRTPIRLNFQQHLRMRFVVDVQAIVLPRPGSLRVVIQHDGVELGQWKIQVNSIGPGAFAAAVRPAVPPA